ncbi:MAG: hypothetical protein AB7E47_16245 [Desulfovibrionaceae bacterium]
MAQQHDTDEQPIATGDTPESLLIGEAQLILAEKRTSLATMRTGIAVFALPLSVMGLLVATSKYYNMTEVFYLLFPLLALCFGLTILGTYLLIRSFVRIHAQDRMILRIKRAHPRLSKIIDV